MGIAIVAVGLVGNAAYGMLGQEVAKTKQVDTLALTAIPLAFGGGMLLPIALSIEGVPRFSTIGWGIVLWLAMVNTACVYLLYNHALCVLAAFELSVILNLTPLVTALLAWLFLGERLSLIQLIGMVTVIGGVVLVQWGKQSRFQLIA